MDPLLLEAMLNLEAAEAELMRERRLEAEHGRS